MENKQLPILCKKVVDTIGKDNLSAQVAFHKYVYTVSNEIKKWRERALQMVAETGEETTPAIGGEAESLAQETPKRPRTFQEKYGRPASAGCTTVGGETEAQIFPPVDGVPEYEPDWPGVIDWFNVLAVNKDGEVWAHVSDPEILGDGFGSDEAYHFDTIPPPPGDTWKQMLYKRPE